MGILVWDTRLIARIMYLPTAGKANQETHYAMLLLHAIIANSVRTLAPVAHLSASLHILAFLFGRGNETY